MNNSGFKPNPASIIVYLGLLAGLGTSIALSLLPLNGVRLFMHLSLAVAMAAMIAVVFMNLRSAGSMLRVFALSGLLWLLFLFVLTPADYLTR